MDPMFNPPLHRQRHQFVIDFITRNKPQKVLDLGCGECSLLKKLKFHREIELLVGVDINGAKVKKHMHGLAPISTDYLQPGFDQLRIELYEGSVTQRDFRLRGFDLVTSVELIEHLTPADVELFSEVLFGYLTPVAVIVSTPNSEFNPLFPGLTGFRHSDHKFEWTRAEFQSWARKACLDYGYEVEFTGVGQAPQGQQDRVGYCTQIGVFQRLGGRDGCSTMFGDDDEDVFSYTLTYWERASKSESVGVDVGILPQLAERVPYSMYMFLLQSLWILISPQYIALYSINYPSLRDNNILRRVLVSEVLYWTETLKRRWMEGNTSEGDEASTLSQTEGGVEESLRALEQRLEMENQTAVCGAERKNLLEQGGGDVSEGQGKQDEEVLWTIGQGQQEARRLHRCMSVPLAALWTCCPKLSTLSGSLSDLRHHLMEEPEVRLSHDGSAVLVHLQDPEEEEHYDLEDSGYAEVSQCSSSAEREEDWEANV